MYYSFRGVPDSGWDKNSSRCGWGPQVGGEGKKKKGGVKDAKTRTDSRMGIRLKRLWSKSSLGVVKTRGRRRKNYYGPKEKMGRKRMRGANLCKIIGKRGTIGRQKKRFGMLGG